MEFLTFDSCDLLIRFAVLCLSRSHGFPLIKAEGALDFISTAEALSAVQKTADNDILLANVFFFFFVAELTQGHLHDTASRTVCKDVCFCLLLNLMETLKSLRMKIEPILRISQQ